MNVNRMMKVTASLHCGSNRHTAIFSAIPSNNPAQAAPRRLPTPPTMVAATLMSMTRPPIAAFNPDVMLVRTAAGTTSREPRAKGRGRYRLRVQAKGSHQPGAFRQGAQCNANVGPAKEQLERDETRSGDDNGDCCCRSDIQSRRELDALAEHRRHRD